MRYPLEVIRSASPSVYVPGVMRGVLWRPRRADGPAAFLAVFGRRLGAAPIDPTALNALAQAIQTQEGFYPGSIAYTNNNPGNLVYVGQPGATPGVGGFAAFSSYNAGLQALENQIQLDATRGTDVNGNPVTTVGQLISSWAPASAGNNTPAYISSVTSQTGYSASDNLLSLGTPAGSDSTDLTTTIYSASEDSTSAGSASLLSSPWLIAAAIGAVAMVALR